MAIGNSPSKKLKSISEKSLLEIKKHPVAFPMAAPPNTIRLRREYEARVDGIICNTSTLVNLRFDENITYHYGQPVALARCNGYDCDVILGKKFIWTGRRILNELPVKLFVWEPQGQAAFLELDSLMYWDGTTMRVIYGDGTTLCLL